MKCPSYSYLNDKQFAPQKTARKRKGINSKGTKTKGELVFYHSYKIRLNQHIHPCIMVKVKHFEYKSRVYFFSDVILCMCKQICCYFSKSSIWVQIQIISIKTSTLNKEITFLSYIVNPKHKRMQSKVQS